MRKMQGNAQKNQENLAFQNLGAPKYVGPCSAKQSDNPRIRPRSREFEFNPGLGKRRKNHELRKQGCIKASVSPGDVVTHVIHDTCDVVM